MICKIEPEPTPEPTHEQPIECKRCRGNGFWWNRKKEKRDCRKCKGAGWFGINPELPICLPAGVGRISYFQVRYASGYMVFNPLDGLTTREIIEIAGRLDLSLDELHRACSTIDSHEELVA